MTQVKGLSPDEFANFRRSLSENESVGGELSCSNLDSDEDIRLIERNCEESEHMKLIMLQCFLIYMSVDSIAIEVLRRPKLTGIVRGKAFLHVLRRHPIGCPDSRKRIR
ncbi:hypothetical protein TNCV_2426751 [Trichonephila clavipes]|nr:hypothetical protein TNCV_2426751 [Trichonephila clavipes]